MGNSINQTIGTLADTLYVDPTCDGEIDEYYAKRLPKSKRLGTVKELITYKEFFESVSCLFTEGGEFMTRDQIYAAIKKDWQDIMHKTDSELLHGTSADRPL